MVNALANPEVAELNDIIDTERYPVDKPDAPGWQALIDRCRAGLADDGSVTLRGFLRSEALDQARDEIAAAAEHAPVIEENLSVYARDLSGEGLDPDDPRIKMSPRRLGHVTRDMIPAHYVAHRLYAASEFKRFIAAAVDRDRVFEYADPLAGLIATILPPGGVLPYHYDTNEFVVTVNTMAPEAGGEFQYIPNLRSPGDENLEGLRRVQNGEADHLIRTPNAAPGDLNIFKGRYSLHRVTEILGSRPRHTMVFSYAERPGIIGPVDRTRNVYGRVTEAHLVAEEFAAESYDGLIK